MNNKKINVVITPRGYGKCYKEYKNVIDYLENEIKQLQDKLIKAEVKIDNAIKICDFYNKKYQKDPLENSKVLFVINNVMNELEKILIGGNNEK